MPKVRVRVLINTCAPLPRTSDFFHDVLGRLSPKLFAKVPPISINVLARPDDVSNHAEGFECVWFEIPFQ